MALPKIYNPIIFSNDSPPELNEDNMNDMSQSLSDLDDRVIDLAGDVIEKAAQIIELGENPPYIGANGNWYIWDTDTGEYVDSGIDASITITIADVSMLPSGSSPYVTNTGTATDPIFHLFIPMGNDGDYGNLSNRPKINGTTLSGSGQGNTYALTDISMVAKYMPSTDLVPTGQTYEKGAIVWVKGYYGQYLRRMNEDASAGSNWVNKSSPVTLSDLINALYTNVENEVITRASLGAHNLAKTFMNYALGTYGSSPNITALNGAMIMIAEATQGETYIITKDVSNGDRFRVAGFNSISFTDQTNTGTDIYADNVNHEYEFTNTAGYKYIVVCVNAYSTVTIEQVKPIIRLATDADTTYRPYAKTNKQLTDNVTDIETTIAPIELGTASQAYAKGDYLIMNDKLYKATAAIVSGATLTVGTNIVQTSVADELKALDVGTYDICGVMSSAYNSYIRCPIPYKRANTKHTVTLNSVKRLADATDYTSSFSVDSSQTGYFTIYSSSTALATQAMIFNITVS